MLKPSGKKGCAASKKCNSASRCRARSTAQFVFSSSVKSSTTNLRSSRPEHHIAVIAGDDLAIADRLMPARMAAHVGKSERVLLAADKGEFLRTRQQNDTCAMAGGGRGGRTLAMEAHDANLLVVS